MKIVLKHLVCRLYLFPWSCVICILPLTLLCSHRDGDVSPHAALDHPRAGALYLLHAGHRLLLPQWSRGPTAPHEGSNWRHLGGHHRSQRVRISPVHLWSSQITQVIFWKGVEIVFIFLRSSIVKVFYTTDIVI